MDGLGELLETGIKFHGTKCPAMTMGLRAESTLGGTEAFASQVLSSSRAKLALRDRESVNNSTIA